MEKKLTNIIDNIKNKGKGPEWMTLGEPGTYVFRILPEVNDEEQVPFEEFYMHGGFIHPLYNKAANVLCLRTRDCPMCVAARKIKYEDPANAWRYEAKPYYVYYIIDRKDGQLKKLKLSWASQSKLVLKIIEAANLGINLMHPKTGRDVELTFRKIDTKSDYKAYILEEKETKPVAQKFIEELKMLRPLREAYRSYTKQELQDIVDGKRTDYKNTFEKPKATSKSSLIQNLNKKMGVTTPEKKPVAQTPQQKAETINRLEKDLNSSDSISSRLDELDLFEEE